MSVTIIRKQSGQANEVTDAYVNATVAHMRKTYGAFIDHEILKEAMEAARIAESGEIERIEVDNTTYDNVVFTLRSGFVSVTDRGETVSPHRIYNNNLIPLAEALLELGKQMKGAA